MNGIIVVQKVLVNPKRRTWVKPLYSSKVIVPKSTVEKIPETYLVESQFLVD